MTESSVLHVHPLSENREVKRLGGFGEPRPKKEKERFSSWLFLDTKGHAVEATLVT